MRFFKIILGVSLIVVLLAASISTGQTSKKESPALDNNLKLLEPLANKKWVGKLKSLNSDQYFEVVRKLNVIWGGKAVKIERMCEELNNELEGYFYWDPDAGKIGMFAINNKGVIQTGFVTEEQGKILVSGTVTFPERKLEYKNYFELTAPDKLLDKWYRLENGEWLPGHTVELTAEQTD